MNSIQPSRFKEKFTELFGVDLRSLAALRVAMATLIIIDLIRRCRDLVAHYTDFGVLPRAALLQDFSRWRISLHLANGTWEFQALLFGIAGACALALMLGYKTHIATVGSWFLLASLHSRNPLILDGGDVLLRLMLFWGIFLPWGACWSVDRALGPPDIKLPERKLSAATFAYVAQIVFVYWFSVLHKTGPEWHEGTAVYYTLQFDQVVTPFGQYLLQFPSLLKLLTHSVVWFERIGPLFLFSPILFGPVRTAAILSFFLLHIGIGICTNVGIFTWAAPFSLLGLLPSWFWDKIPTCLKRTERLRTEIYYDQDCSICLRTARLVERFLLLSKNVVAPAQSNPSIESDMRLHNSWVVIDHQGTKHFRFSALSTLAARSPLIWPLAIVLRTSFSNRVGDWIYEVIANHRGCPINRPSAPPRRSNLKLGISVNLLILFLLGYVFMWNLKTLPNFHFKLSERSSALGELLRIDQIWNMFAPRPPMNDGWYVIGGRLKNGEVVDLFRNGASVSWGKPVSVGNLFQSYRWWKYLLTIWNKGDNNSWLNYSSYLCRAWNADHDLNETVEHLRIIYVLETTLPNYDVAPLQKILLFEHHCGEKQ